MSIIESIRDFIATCPFIEELDAIFPPVNVDKLEPEPSYSIESVPSDPIVKRCINGDSIRRVTFYLCSRNLYGAEENLDTSQFYEKQIRTDTSMIVRQHMPSIRSSANYNIIKKER